MNGSTNILPICNNELLIFSFIQISDFYQQGENIKIEPIKYDWDKINQIITEQGAQADAG